MHNLLPKNYICDKLQSEVKTVEIFLFRVKILKSLFSPPRSTQEIFELAIAQKPSLKLEQRNKNVLWKIGNVTKLEQSGLTFAIGKEVKKEKPVIDEITGDFVEKQDGEAPFTYIIADTNLGVIGICSNYQLSSHITTIANYLQHTLGASKTIENFSVTIRVDPIYEVQNILTEIMDSHRILQLKLEYHRPNPPDPNRYLQEPVEEAILKTNSQDAKVTLTGDNLSKSETSKIVSAAIATGNEVSVKRIKAINSVADTISSKDESIAKITVDSLSPNSLEDRPVLLFLVREKYKEIRGHDEN